MSTDWSVPCLLGTVWRPLLQWLSYCAIAWICCWLVLAQGSSPWSSWYHSTRMSKSFPPAYFRRARTIDPILLKKVPEEIWLQIFLETYDSSELYARERQVVAFGSVCRYWRNITHNSSALWTSIGFREGPPEEWDNRIACFKSKLTRSGSRLIEVDIAMGCSQSYLPDLLSELFPHFHRLSTLKIILKLQPNPSKLGPLEDEPRTLKLPPALPRSPLKRLHLHNVIFESPTHQIRLLEQCPSLEQLQIHSYLRPQVWPAPIPDGRLSLPSLKWAALQAPFFNAMAFADFEAPALYELNIVNFRRWLPSSSSIASLRILKLTGTFEDDEATVLLMNTPELLELFITFRSFGNGAGDDIIRFLTREDSELGFYLPKLRYLTLSGGVFNDARVIHLLDVRTGADGPARLTLHICGCRYTTRALAVELRERQRGSWCP